MTCPLGYRHRVESACDHAPCSVCMRQFGEKIADDIDALGIRANGIRGDVQARLAQGAAMFGLSALVMTSGSHNS